MLLVRQGDYGATLLVTFRVLTGGRTGDRMTASIGIDGAATGEAVTSYEPVQLAGAVPSGQALTTMLCRRPAQPSRRAVLHVRAPGDPAVPARLADWYTERAFNFFAAEVRLPGRRPHRLRPAFADLDAASAHLRGVEGMHDVIVVGHGSGALAAAVWSDARRRATADALILCAPAFPGRGLDLSIDCPVLVLCHAAATSPRQRPRRRPVPPARLGGHVTWRQLPETTGLPSSAGDADVPAILAEVGRWLGAYMYGQLRGELI